MDFNRPRKRKQKKEQKNNELKYKFNINFMSDEELSEEFFGEFSSIIEIPNFPDDFYHYTGTKKITDEEINLWIEECVCFLEEDPDETFATAQSGDTKLIVLRVQEGDKYHYLIEVFRERYSIEISPEEL